MPNHVYTDITITGPADALNAIAVLAKDNKSILDHYLPLPDTATKQVSYVGPTGETISYSAYTDGGYSTAVDLWGSKWPDYEVDLLCDDRDHDGSITVRCQSAWSPLTEGYRKLSALLDIRAVLAYTDEGGCFVGASAVAAGEVVADYTLYESAFETALAEAGVGDYPRRDDFASDDDHCEAEMAWREAFDIVEGDVLNECRKKVEAVLASAIA
jgi:hypothetical protein